MLTKLTIENFKAFTRTEMELASCVVFTGPNNSGKTSALQAITLWDIGAKRWLEKHGSKSVSAKQTGVTVGRWELTAIPVSSVKLLWHDLRVRQTENGSKQQICNLPIRIGVEGVTGEKCWQCYLEFHYANEESIHCRPLLAPDGRRLAVPEHLRELRVAYLSPLFGLTTREDRLETGAIRVRMGEGRTADILRNLCWLVLQEKNGEQKWEQICGYVQKIFGSRLNRPQYIAERGEITMSYRTLSGTLLDISAAGRGEQQTILLLAYMAMYPGGILLLDEPDAHLEVSLQRQIFDLLFEQAQQTNSQLIIATHSEILVDEVAKRGAVVYLDSSLLIIEQLTATPLSRC